MNAKTEQELIQFHQELFSLDKRDLTAIIDILALNSVEEFITSNPLPEGADPDAMRTIMLMMTVMNAAKRVQSLLDKARAAGLVEQSPTPEQEDVAKAEAAAAIIKAQGQLH